MTVELNQCCLTMCNADGGPPTVPTGLVATNALQSVALDWDDTAGATTYDVRRSPGGAGTWTTIATLVAVSNYTDSTTAANTSYDYEVRAVNASGNSDWTSSVSGEQTALLIDHFTGVDATDLNAHTMDLGAGYTKLSGTIAIQSNRAQTSGSANYKVDGIVADFTETCIINLPVGVAAGSDNGVFFRLVDANNSWLATLVTRGAGGGTLYLYEVNGGGFTIRASGSISVSTTTDYTIQIVAAATSITATVGSTVINYASATFNQTAHLFGFYAETAGVIYDDLQVTR